jgi:hypothetical protein
LKDFPIFSERFQLAKERLKKHQTVFEACCTLVQYDVDVENSMFAV